MSVVIYVPDIPEFASLIAAIKTSAGCRLIAPQHDYWQIEAGAQLTLERKALGLGPALWYSLLSGGFHGRISEYGRDRLCIASED